MFSRRKGCDIGADFREDDFSYVATDARYCHQPCDDVFVRRRSF